MLVADVGARVPVSVVSAGLSALQTCKSFEFLVLTQEIPESRHTNTLPHDVKRSGGCPVSSWARICARAIAGESFRPGPFPTLPVLQWSTGRLHIRPKRHDLPDPVVWVGTEMFGATNRP